LGDGPESASPQNYRVVPNGASPETKEGFYMFEDRRTHPRFEPSSVNVSVKTTAGTEFSGYLLDVSRGGLAIDLPQKVDLPDIGSKVDVEASNGDSLLGRINLGTATVLRTWTQSAYFDDGKGIALSIDNQLVEYGKYRFLLRGVQQCTRLESQTNLAAKDIEHLSAYRRSLSECLMKLYTSTLTLSVSLAATYFALNYYGIATNRLSDPDMSFWRTLLAALPGIIAVVFALMISQKNASIQRVDAYLAVLKECLVKNQYPREYRGWETESLKFRDVMKTAACKDCKIIRKCGTFKESEKQAIDSRKLFRDPFIDLYYIIMHLTFFSILIASIIAIIIELRKFQWSTGIYMLASSVITFIMLLAIFGIFYLTVQLRKGRYSFEYYTRCWIDLLSRCRKSIHP